MKRLFYLLMCFIPLLSYGAKKEKEGANLIPYPTSVEWKSGGFVLKDGVAIYAESCALPIATYLQDVLGKGCKISATVKPISGNESVKNGIFFVLVNDEKYGEHWVS